MAALQDAVRESVETLAFAEVGGWEERGTDAVEMEACIGARIQVKKPLPVVLSLFLGRRQCTELMGTVNGGAFFEDDGGEELLDDFMTELVNTVAGRFSASLAGETKVAGLGLPEPIRDWEMALGECDRKRKIVFTIDDQPAFLCIEEF